MSDVEIKEIRLKLNDKEISLTVKEAKKLQSLLENLFGDKIVHEKEVEHHYHHDYFPRYYFTPSPAWTGTNCIEYVDSGTITLSANTEG